MSKGNRFAWLLFLAAIAYGRTSPVAHGQSASDLTRKLDLLKAYPDTIVVNGEIHTINNQLTEMQAMAVKNGRILAVGMNDEIRFLAGPRTEVLDAKGRVVLPGLIDGHTHPHVWAVEHWMGAGGNAAGDWAVKRYNQPEMKIVYARGNDQAEVLRSLERLVRQRAQELGPGKWIWVTAFAKSNIVESREIVEPLFQRAGGEPGTISRKFLDTLAPNNPLQVFNSEIIGGDAHNTKAKEEMEKFWVLK